MKLRLAAPLLLLLLAAPGCSSLSVSADWDREFPFSSLRTYAWATSKESDSDMVFLDRRIKRAVNEEMAAKGYQRRDAGGDFLVLYTVKVRDRIDVYRDRYRWGGYTSTDRYKEGTLMLGVVDRGTDEIVWTGWAEGIVSRSGQSEEKIRDAVARILEKFPPS